MTGNYLLPHRFRWAGMACLLAGMAALVIYQWFDFRIMMPVFAVFSSFLQTKYFTVIQTNAADEIMLLLLLAGLFILSFTKEKNESDEMEKIRSKALFLAFITNTALLAFAVLFLYGNGFLGILFLNLFSPFILYIGYRWWLKRQK
jgi:hypothetical protein